MQEWEDQNKGYRYILNIVDCFSKYAWSIPLKDKKAETVLNAFKTICKESDRKPKHIWVDEGKEFYNKKMDEWLKDNAINRYSTHGPHKSAIVERFNRSIKQNMWKLFTAYNTRKWIDMLPKLVSDYNNKRHSSTKLKPVDAILPKNRDKVCLRANYGEYIPKAPKFKIGDTVRISRIKGLFEKGYLPNYSEEVFTIAEVKPSNPITYILKDSVDNLIQGGFYEQELQQTKQEIFRIEAVIKKKKIKGVEHGLVKWLGYSKKFNQWLPMIDIEKVPNFDLKKSNKV
jgi:hypothetical protein